MTAHEFRHIFRGRKPDDEAAVAAAAAAAAAAATAESDAAAAAAATEAEAAAAAKVKAATEAEAEAAATAAAKSSKETPDIAAEKADLLREVMDKKTKLKEATEALAAYKGVDPKKVAALLKAEKDAETAAAEAKGDFERVKNMMVEQHTAELTEVQTTLEKALSDISSRDKIIDDLTVGNDFGMSTFIKEDLTLAPDKVRKLYGDHFEVKDGRTIAYDKPAGQTDRTMLVDSKGVPMSFDVSLKKIIDADSTAKDMLRDKTIPGSSSKSTKSTTIPGKSDTSSGLFGVSRIAASLGALE